jgi:alpha-1,2-mannosyltransferase
VSNDETLRPVASGLRARWWLASAILVAVVLAAVLYYRAVWGGVPALVTALDHCQELYCDFVRQYHPTGREVLASGQPSRGYFYSSFFALLLVPFGRLEPGPAVAWWSVVQLGGVLLLLLPAANFYRESRAAFALYVILLAFSMPLLHNLKWGQVSALVTGGVFASHFLYQRDRPATAAVVLAFAAAIKYYVAIFLLVFMVRRDRRFLITFILTFAVLWLVVPTVILGTDGNWAFYQTVRERMAHALSSWMQEDINAQYLPSVLGRWFNLPAGNLYSRLAGLAIFIANVLAVTRLLGRRASRDMEWAFALLFLSLPFVVATSWPHYFVFLPFVQTLVYLEVRGRGVLWQWALLVVSIVLASMPFFQVVGSWQAYSRFGFLFIANLCLFILAHALTLRQPSAGSDHQAPAATPAAERP